MKKTIFSLLLLLGVALTNSCRAQSDPYAKPIKIKINIKTHFRFTRNCESGFGLCVEIAGFEKSVGPVTGITTYEGVDYLIIKREGLSDETITQFESAKTFPIDEDLYLAPEQLQSTSYKGGIMIYRGNYPIRIEDLNILIPIKFDYQ